MFIEELLLSSSSASPQMSTEESAFSRSCGMVLLVRFKQLSKLLKPMELDELDDEPYWCLNCNLLDAVVSSRDLAWGTFLLALGGFSIPGDVLITMDLGRGRSGAFGAVVTHWPSCFGERGGVFSLSCDTFFPSLGGFSDDGDALVMAGFDLGMIGALGAVVTQWLSSLGEQGGLLSLSSIALDRGRNGAFPKNDLVLALLSWKAGGGEIIGVTDGGDPGSGSGDGVA